MCTSRKHPHPPDEKLIEIARGRGIANINIFKGK